MEYGRRLWRLFGLIVTGRELQFPDRADFDGAMYRVGGPAGHFDGFIQIFAIQHVEARELCCLSDNNSLPRP